MISDLRVLDNLTEEEEFVANAADGWLGAKNLYDMFSDRARTYPGHPALTHISVEQGELRSRTLSYSGLLEEVTRAGNVLTSLGVQRDHVVALLLPNMMETFSLLWGTSAVAIAFPINYLLAPEAIAGLMAASGAKILVAPGDHPDLWAKALAIKELRGAELECLIRVGGPSVADDFAFDFEQKRSAVSGERLMSPEPELDEVAAIFHTGGTSGLPKLVKHSHKNQLAAAFGLALRFQMTPHDTSANGLPMFHVGGAIVATLSAFFSGAHVVNLSPTGFRNPEIMASIWEIVAKHRITILTAVPTALGSIAKVPVAGADISSLRLAIAGAAPLPSVTAELFESVASCSIHEAYGMTETASLISCEPWYAARKKRSAGIAAPFLRAETRQLLANGRTGGVMAADDVGVLVVQGPCVTPGYVDSHHNAEAFTDDGWLITGDIVRIDADGCIQIVGRSKDIIIRSGHNIDPQMIEEAALSFPDVLDVAAVGQPDKYAGELPVCFVVPRNKSTFDPDALLRHLASTVIERPAVPKRLYVMNALPITSLGKISKPDLRREAIRLLVHELLHDLGPISVVVKESLGSTTTVEIRLPANLARSSPVLNERLDGHLFLWQAFDALE